MHVVTYVLGKWCVPPCQGQFGFLTFQSTPSAVLATERKFMGATYLLDQFGKEIGVEADLELCFPEEYKQILSIAYYLILEENNSLSRFSHWHRLHCNPYSKDIASQRSSELFQGITEEQRMAFFKKQGKRRIENEYWAFDTTSISSYSDTLKQVKLGNNKEVIGFPSSTWHYYLARNPGCPSTTSNSPATSRM